MDALPKDAEKNRAALPFLRQLQESVKEDVQEMIQETEPESAAEEWISMPFLHDMTPDIQAK